MTKLKPRKANPNSTSDPIEAAVVDSSLAMFRDMLLKEYKHRIDEGNNPDSISETLAKSGIMFDVLLRDMPDNTPLLMNRVKNELEYITNNYYDLYALYRKISAVLGVLYVYSDVSTGLQYADKARKYLDAVLWLAPGDGYDEQASLCDEQASLCDETIAVLKGIGKGTPIVGPKGNEDNTLDTANVLSNIALEELNRLESEISNITGYIGTYAMILEKTLHDLEIASKKRVSFGTGLYNRRNI